MPSDQQEKLIEEYTGSLGPLPKRVPLDMKILSKRKPIEHEEWKIEYTGEGPETMQEPSLSRIPAYLLIPRRDRYEPPYPAVVAFHQCNCDCWIGKEAVVGKKVDRRDQAYGYELVAQGFVVLAPDHWNCGERNVPGVRTEGEQVVGCFGEVMQCAGKSNWQAWEAFEASRAVDVLQSLDFVDGDRIAAVGHSMGTQSVISGMAVDPRIKAGIVSGAGPGKKQLACIAPRPFMQLQGLYDGGPKRAEELEEIHSSAGKFYEAAGAPDNLLLRVAPCSHHFLDEFKWEAYTRLKKHFGMTDAVERLSLAEVLRDALQGEDDFQKHYTERLPHMVGSHAVMGCKKTLVMAFRSLLDVVIKHKFELYLPLSVEVIPSDTTCELRFTVAGGSRDSRGVWDDAYAEAGQLFAESDATLRRGCTSGDLEYIVELRSAD